MSPSHTPRQGTWGYKWNFNFRTLDSHSHIHHCRQLHVICICHNNTDPITETCFLHVCVPVLRVRRPYLPSHTFAPEYCFRRLVCILFVFLCFFYFIFVLLLSFSTASRARRVACALTHQALTFQMMRSDTPRTSSPSLYSWPRSGCSTCWITT